MAAPSCERSPTTSTPRSFRPPERTADRGQGCYHPLPPGASSLDGVTEIRLNGRVRAVGLRVRGALRRRWVAVLGVTIIVAIVSGAVLTLTAGARRTASTPGAFTRAVGGDVDASLQQSSGAPRTAEVRALPGVKSVSAMTFAFVGLKPAHGQPLDNAISFIGEMPAAARLVAGREPDPKRADEFVASTDFVAGTHARIGEKFSTFSWTRAQAGQGEGFNAKPMGPSFTAHLVGIFQSAGSLEDQYSVSVFSPALLHADIGLV